MVKTKVGEFSQDPMWAGNVGWDAFNGLLSVFFGLLRILSSISVFIGYSRNSVIAYVGILILVRPLTMLSGDVSLFQSCELCFVSSLLLLSLTLGSICDLLLQQYLQTNGRSRQIGFQRKSEGRLAQQQCR